MSKWFVTLADSVLGLLVTMVLVLAAPTAALGSKNSSLKNFVPGNYVLTEGEEAFCKSGKFSLADDGSRIWLGPHYVFLTKDTTLTGNSDFVIEKGCKESTEYKVEIKGKQTFVKSTDVITCKGEIRQTIVNEATITKTKISLTQSHDLNPKNHDKAGGSPHSCAWQLSKK